MPHYKSMFDEADYLFAFDLDGKDFTLEIAKVSGGVLTGKDGRKAKKPMIEFVGAKKKLAINKTNGATIAKLYGTDVSAWVGKFVTLYPTMTTFGGESMECIRVRPVVPEQRKAAAK